MWGFTAASLAGGAPPHSLHLTALVQLVREIPEFLFGEVSPETESGSGAVSLDGEQGSPEGKSDNVKFKLGAVGLPVPCQTLGGVVWVTNVLGARLPPRRHG